MGFILFQLCVPLLLKTVGVFRYHMQGTFIKSEVSLNAKFYLMLLLLIHHQQILVAHLLN